MRVVPPPPPAPRLMVVNSRITLPSPIPTATRSPLYFLSCGSPPIAAWPWMRLSRPTQLETWKTQHGPTRVPDLTPTSAPMECHPPPPTTPPHPTDTPTPP